MGKSLIKCTTKRCTPRPPVLCTSWSIRRSSRSGNSTATQAVHSQDTARACSRRRDERTLIEPRMSGPSRLSSARTGSTNARGWLQRTSIRWKRIRRSLRRLRDGVTGATAECGVCWRGEGWCRRNSQWDRRTTDRFDQAPWVSERDQHSMLKAVPDAVSLCSKTTGRMLNSW